MNEITWPHASRTAGETSRRPPWLIPAAGAAVVLVVAGAIWGVAAAQSAAAQPGQVAARYCLAVLARDYTDEAALVAASALGGTVAHYVANEQVRETVDGRVTACHAGDAASGPFAAVGFAMSSPSQASVPLTLTRARLGSRSGTLTLSRVGGSWRVTGLSAPLQGTNLAPLQVAATFCAALAAAHYADAYAALSARQQQTEKSVVQFTAQATQPAGATFTGCTPNYTSYALNGATATLKLTLNVKVAITSGTPTVPVAATMTLVQENGAWKVDGLAIAAQ
jgi:hypothetical protein